ncbi:MAG: DUF5110 domain-containing protein [Bacteroidales bacterium]|nr:DUF5110 domain-containing protein [Bacteroidales bacterium]
MKKILFAIIFPAMLLMTACSGPSEIVTDCAKVRLTVYNPSIIRVEKGVDGESFSNDPGLTVVMDPQKAKFKTKKTDTAFILTTEALEVSVNLSDATISVRRKGTPIIAENSGYQPGFQRFALDNNEAIYGLGQHRDLPLNLRGKEIKLLNVNMEISIPLVHSSKGYAIFWNNLSSTLFSDSAEGMSFKSEVGEGVDYFVISGDSADDVIAGIRELSGQVPMFPLWTYGFAQSKERYLSQEETVGVLRKYRELQVPIDCIVQDWQYWGEDNNQWNALKFNNPRFPAPKAMFDEIHSLNAHCMISVWPTFGPETEVYAEMKAAGALSPYNTFPWNSGARNYDPFNAEAREIYWNHMRSNLYDLGVDAWWLDATEPEIETATEGDQEWETAAGSFRKLRNLYPLPSVKGVYESQVSYDPSKRPFILTRSGALGLQRYAICWSGDIDGDWDVLAYQIPAALNYSLCGLPYWNSDLGGFFPADKYAQGCKDPAYRELYLRWAQFGVFTGMMRSHGTRTPREIYNFAEPGDIWFEYIKDAIKLRYKLLPYIYSTAWDIHAHSATLMRALMMDWPGDAIACNTEDEFMFGPSLLVAPIVEPATARMVYLPEGMWYDWWSGEEVQGAQTIYAQAPLDRIPLYAKGGSIIPEGEDVQYTGESFGKKLTMRVYPGADASFELYEDAGDGTEYLHGEYSIIRFLWDDARGVLTLSAREGGYPNMPQKREIEIVFPDGSGTLVNYVGEKIEIGR